MSVPTDLMQAYNAYREAQRGGVRGYGSAAANAGKLYGSLAGNKLIGQYGAGLGNLLGIYSGIQQGGVGGYGGAAVNAAQLGSAVGAFGDASGAIGNAAGYAAIPLALYNEVNSWESGATGKDALGGASTGAAIGTAVLPGIGTAIGALLGGAAGALSSAFGPGRKDPETSAFDKYVAAYHNALKTGGNDAANKVAQANADPYLTMAGYFDLRPGQIKGDNPLYSTYGRMGEQKFTNDLTSHINDAFKSGQLAFGPNGALIQKNPGGGSTTYTNPNDVAGEVYNNAVAPWIQSMGGWNDVNKDALTSTLQQMTRQYVSGQAGQQWKAIGGDNPFSNVYNNSAMVGSAQAAQRQGQRQAAQQAVAALPQDLFKAPGMGGATTALAAAEGGHVKTHFDDGGSYDWGSFSDPTLSDPGTTDYFDQSNPFSSFSQDIGDTGNIVNAYNDPYAYGMDPGSASGAGSASGGAGGIAGLLKSLGVSGNTAQSLAPYAALAPILGSLFGMNNKQGQAPGLPSQYGGTVLNMGTPNYTRQQNNLSNMSMNDWLHAGEGPEIQFYRNNALPATQMSAPNQQAAQALSAATGQPFAGGYQYAPIAGSGQSTVGGVAPSATPAPAANPRMGIMPIKPSVPNFQLPVMAAGGPYDNPHAAYGSSTAGHVRGPGDGTSDSIQLSNAYLSDGEFVMDAPTVSLIGNGSNDAGAKWLDGLRQHVRKNAGKHMVKGKQPMNTRQAAAEYAYGGPVQ